MKRQLSILAISLLMMATTNYAAEDSSGSDDDSSWTGSSITGIGGNLVLGSGSSFISGLLGSGGGNISVNGITISGGSNIPIINGRVISSGDTPLITGSGKVACKEWNFDTFTGITASGPGTLEIIAGECDNKKVHSIIDQNRLLPDVLITLVCDYYHGGNRIIARADDNIIGKLSVSLRGEDLAIELDAKSSIQPRTSITYSVQLDPTTLALLTSLKTSITTRIKTPLSVKKLLLSMTGMTGTNALTAEADLKIENELSVQTSGTGAMSLARLAAQQLMLNHSGTGRLSIVTVTAGCHSECLIFRVQDQLK